MSLSILLVDDAGFIRSMLREILETEGGHRVVAEASDGAAALALQPELKPDLIISDIIMPGMDGIEMTRSLVASDPSVRVVVSAAHDQEGAVLRALAAGAVDFLRKPFSALEVLETLAEPPLPPEPAEGEESLLLVRIALKPFTPLPAARLRVLSSRCARMGRIVRLSPDPARAPAAGGSAGLEAGAFWSTHTHASKIDANEDMIVPPCQHVRRAGHILEMSSEEKQRRVRLNVPAQ